MKLKLNKTPKKLSPDLFKDFGSFPEAHSGGFDPASTRQKTIFHKWANTICFELTFLKRFMVSTYFVGMVEVCPTREQVSGHTTGVCPPGGQVLGHTMGVRPGELSKNKPTDSIILGK